MLSTFEYPMLESFTQAVSLNQSLGRLAFLDVGKADNSISYESFIIFSSVLMPSLSFSHLDKVHRITSRSGQEFFSKVVFNPEILIH